MASAAPSARRLLRDAGFEGLFIGKPIVQTPSFGSSTVNPTLGASLSRKALDRKDHAARNMGIDLPIGPNLARFKSDSFCRWFGHAF